MTKIHSSAVESGAQGFELLRGADSEMATVHDIFQPHSQITGPPQGERRDSQNMSRDNPVWI